MKQVFSEVIQFRGSYYDFGREQAKRLQASPLLRNHKKRRGKSRRKYTVDYQVAKRLLNHYSPGLLEELTGLADGLGWTIEDTIHEYSGWQQEWIHSGCSIFTAGDLIARNYDYHPKTYEGRFILFQPDNGIATIGPSQRVIGRTDGMNAYGLCIGYNFVNRIKPLDGFICCTLTRIILENCQTTEEAVALLKELPHRHSFNYVISDSLKHSAIVEGSPRGVQARSGNVCTNHFTDLEKENRRHLGDSEDRMLALQGRVDRIDDARDAFHYLNESQGPIFSEQYSRWSGTIHTAIYDNERLQVLFGLGGDANPVFFDFNDWLEGRRTTVKRMLGALNTSERIPYIED